MPYWPALVPVSSAQQDGKIVIRGARTHNLKNINLILPRDKLIVVTGLSGSGKSSWRSIPSMPKASAAMWSRSPPMPASSSP